VKPFDTGRGTTEAGRRYGLEMNGDKTTVMRTPLHFMLDQEQLQNVEVLELFGYHDNK
jgi:hypothetical protein